MIVVTGAAGFIGSNVLAALDALARRGALPVGAGADVDGAVVLGVDRRPLRPPAGGVTGALAGDLLAPTPELRGVLRRADVVVHLAGRAGVRDLRPGASRRWWLDNVVATDALLATVRIDAHVVVASSSSVYGGSTGGRPCGEGEPLRPMGGYARSKAAVERRCAERRGPTTVLRPFTVVGEGQRADMALAGWIDAAARGLPLRVFGDPGRSRDLTDVAEVVRAVLAVVERRWTGVLNVGTGVAVTLGDMVAAVQRVVGPAPIELAPADGAEPDHTLASTDRIAAALGFRPVTDLDAVVRRQASAQLARPVGAGRPSLQSSTT